MNTTVKTLLGLLALLLPGVLATVYISPQELFHYIHPLTISISILVVLVYFIGAIESWSSNGHKLTPAHILTLGIILNWIGFSIRIGRWFFTQDEPDFPFEYGYYNLGLWLSTWAGIFMLAAAGLVVKRPKILTLLVAFVSIAALLYYFDIQNWDLTP